MEKIVPVEVNEHNSEYCKIRENFAFRFGYNSPKENLLAFKTEHFLQLLEQWEMMNVKYVLLQERYVK